MNPSDPTPTLQALGRASPAESRGLPPSSAAQTQAVEDLATALMLSQSPAPQPMPAGGLKAIQARIEQRQKRTLVVKKVMAAVQWSGWAVAAGIMFWVGPLAHLIPGNSGLTSSNPSKDSNETRVGDSPSQDAHANKAKSSANATTIAAQKAGEKQQVAEVRELREQVTALKKSVEQLTHPQPGLQRLSIVQPGQGALDSKTLVSLVSAALRPALAHAHGVNSLTNPEIVIESGYTNFSAADLPEGYYYRHRAFPTDHWQSLGLLAAADGTFYDSMGGLVWTPDPSGDGSYIGMPPAQGFNFNAYSASASPQLATSNSPSGSGANKALQNAASPRPAPGGSNPEPSVVAIIKTDGGEGQLVIANANIKPGQVLYAYQEQLDPQTGRVIGYKPVGSSGSTSSPLPQGNNPLALNPNTKGYTFIGPTQSQSLVASTSSTGSGFTTSASSIKYGSTVNGTSIMNLSDLGGMGNIILMSGANPQSPATIPP